MKRVIFSIYIDIPKDLLDPQPPLPGDTEDKNQKAKREFANHYQWLLTQQQQYAADIGADYKHFVFDQKYIDLRKWYNEKFPYITEYNIVNFYKIHLMYELADQYDEILYLDLDVLPTTKQSFFDHHDLTKGPAIKKNGHGKTWSVEYIKRREERFTKFGFNQSIRSPSAKWWNSKALCVNYGKPIDDLPVYNTGIVGINKQWLDQLDYFGDFDDLLEEMYDMKYEEDSMWPSFVQAMFGWDNETIWGFKSHINNIQSQWLDGKWHVFLNEGIVIPQDSKLVHIVSKEFAQVRRWYEENYL